MKKEPDQTPLALSKEQAETIMRANARNLVQKVHAGKTLSASERRILEAIIDGGQTADNFAKNQVDLAQALGVSRKTVQRWLRLEGNPGTRPDGRYDVTAWRVFKAQRHGDDPGDTDPASQTQLRARQILLQNQKLEHQIRVLTGAYVKADDVEQWGAELGGAIRRIVLQLHTLAPALVGLTVPDCEKRLKEVEDEILGQMNGLKDHVNQMRAAAQHEQTE